MKLLISALLVAVAVAIKHSSVHSFVDVSSASVVRTITTVHLEEPLAAADAYLVSVPNAVFVKAECDKSCTVGKVSSVSIVYMPSYHVNVRLGLWARPTLF